MASTRIALIQLCSSRRPHAAQTKILYGPVWVFAAVEVAYILPTCPYFDNLEFAILMQVALSVTSSRLLPLHLGFERFQYISLS